MAWLLAVSILFPGAVAKMCGLHDLRFFFYTLVVLELKTKTEEQGHAQRRQPSSDCCLQIYRFQAKQQATGTPYLEQFYSEEVGSIVQEAKMGKTTPRNRSEKTWTGCLRAAHGLENKRSGIVLTFQDCWLKIADIHIHLSQQCSET